MMGAKINRANTPIHAVIRDVQESPGLRCCRAIELIFKNKNLLFISGNAIRRLSFKTTKGVYQHILLHETNPF